MKRYRGRKIKMHRPKKHYKALEVYKKEGNTNISYNTLHGSVVPLERLKLPMVLYILHFFSCFLYHESIFLV